jgi:hypothetical protein
MRHVDVYVALAEQAKDELLGPQQDEWLSRLDLEIEPARCRGTVSLICPVNQWTS